MRPAADATAIIDTAATTLGSSLPPLALPPLPPLPPRGRGEPPSPSPPTCDSCLVVGVTLCGAMTTYFAHQAFDPVLLAKSRYNKPIFLAVAGAWAVAGVYRYSLG
jgi:hypothetical protein